MTTRAASPLGTTGTNHEPIIAGLDQFLTLLKRRKILWEFHLGTVSSQIASGFTNIPVVLDSDTVSINAQSIIGSVVPGARVCIIFVPPSGYFIIGGIGSAAAGSVLTDVNGKSMIYGTSNSGTVIAETTVLTSPVFTFPSGCVFSVKWGWGFQAIATTSRPNFSVHALTSNNLLVDDGEKVVGAAARNYSAHAEGIFCNNSGANITDSLILTLRDNSGASGALLAGSASRPSFFGPITILGTVSQFTDKNGIILPTM